MLFRSGSKAHKLIEMVSANGGKPLGAMSPFLVQNMNMDLLNVKVGNWFKENCAKVVESEGVIVSQKLGLAGTCDLIMEHKEHGLVMVDFKTQRIPAGKKHTAYPEWCWQLAAYSCTVSLPIERCLSVVIPTVPVGDLINHWWDDDDISQGYIIMTKLTELWQMIHDYHPQNVEMPPASSVVDVAHK